MLDRLADDRLDHEEDEEDEEEVDDAEDCDDDELDDEEDDDIDELECDSSSLEVEDSEDADDEDDDDWDDVLVLALDDDSLRSSIMYSRISGLSGTIHGASSCVLACTSKIAGALVAPPALATSSNMNRKPVPWSHT